MGVERAVTRWYVRHQLLLDEIALLETKNAPSSTDDGETSPLADADILQKLAQAQEKLHVLGPCPSPMMG
ncbi:MAG: hypothetical protein NVS4B11_08800 [Ktedonobacteraceae bacterium]